MDWHSYEIDELIGRPSKKILGRAMSLPLATVPARPRLGRGLLPARPWFARDSRPSSASFGSWTPDIDIELLAKDGDAVEKRRDLVRCRVRARAILTGERTALNFLGHLSGIATLTQRFVERIAGNEC